MKKKCLAILSGAILSFLSSCDNGTSSNDDEITSLNDSRDGQVYDVVKIGNQVWMAKNLNYEIPVAAGETPRSYCYDNREDYCQQYGRLYTWDDAKTICPQGWHLPDTTEWNKLFDFAGGQLIAGEKLKATNTAWNNNGYGTDEFGFGALPGGFNKSATSFYDLGQYGNFWTTASSNSTSAYHVTVFYNKKSADYITDSQSFGLSVRCIKN